MLNIKTYYAGFLILAIGIAIGLIISANPGGSERPLATSKSYSGTAVQLGAQSEIPGDLLSLQNTSEAFIAVSEHVVPTVVTIESTRLITSADLRRFHNQDELKDYFRFRVPDEFRQQGAGSGIIVSENGFILTNVHVVARAEKLRVQLSDNRVFPAEIVGLDPLTEVAVVKIDADNLPVAHLGNSDKIRVGEWVLAIGNPLDLRSTVTAGIISAKEREIDIIEDTYSVETFLQTDAAINPGNSGGALVNLRGEVIGVNTAIATETGLSAGFGFAIPINLAGKIMLDLIEKGRVSRGYLGIAMQTIDEKKARALNLTRPRGVFVDRVLKNSPAEQAGILSKDVILELDHVEVNKSNQVQAIIAKKNPGEQIQARLLRAGDSLTVDVILGERETEEVAVALPREKPSFDNLGLTIKELSRSQAEELGYQGPRGVVVTKVERLSPAEESGILEDDVIMEIDGHKISRFDDFDSVVPKLEPGSVSMFTVRRFNDEVHIFVEVPQD